MHFLRRRCLYDTGSSSDNNVQMVKQGFDDMLADTDLHVVYEANCDGWTAELAAGYVEEALEKYPHVKGNYVRK